MIDRQHKYGFLAGQIILWFMLIPLFWGCSKDNNPPIDEPFVRLIENQVLNSQILNYPVRYAVLLPDDYENSGATYPVIYLLHGYGDNHTAWHKGGAIQYYADLYQAEAGSAIYVMPQAFNTYYVNKFDGTFNYMDMFVQELVPLIDELFRTKKDPTQRALMGYSMGGYGALILAAKNPDIFTISVPLSMSFRTDDQYVSQSQDGWNSQFGAVFGGSGASGENRITDYFKLHSPFHFFDNDDLSAFEDLRLFIDCGDDEESLHITNGALHNLLRDKNFDHAYRVRNGNHSWNYWHGSLKEAMHFIGNGFRGKPYPKEPLPAVIGESFSISQLSNIEVQGISGSIAVFKPVSYESSVDSFPLIVFLNDIESANGDEQRLKSFSLLNNKMKNKSIAEALIVEVVVNSSETFSSEDFEVLKNHISDSYRVKANKTNHVIIGNGTAAGLTLTLTSDYSNFFNACFIFNGIISENPSSAADVFYYLDRTDYSHDYLGNFQFFLDLRNNNYRQEYRVRQGMQSYQAFINGLDQSVSLINAYLKN